MTLKMESQQGKRTSKRKEQRKAVLGLRASQEGRAYMVAMAKARGLSLQSYFDEVMRKQPDSPWVKESEYLVAVPVEMRPAVSLLHEIWEMNNRQLWHTAMHSLEALKTLGKTFIRGDTPVERNG